MSTVFPFALDDDSTIQRIDDNLSAIGVDVINAMRSAIFAVENTVGIQANGSKNSIADRLNVSLDSNGSIKASALTSIGLVSLPITNIQVGSNAGIAESKLSLTHSTTDLYSLIQINSTLLASISAFQIATSANFTGHVAGATLKLDGTSNRHVASHIDLNQIPSDTRDAAFIWAGLIDKTGALRSAVTVAQALLQINIDLVTHENSTFGAHTANAVAVSTTNFTEIPPDVTDVQKLADYLNDNEVTKIGEHRAVQHSNGVPPAARVQSFILPDGYNDQIVPPTPVTTYLVRAPSTSPVDSISQGDDIVRFVPNNSGFVFDGQFQQVQVGDSIRINYGNGIEASFPVDSIRYIPGSEWVVRINGTNLFDPGDGYALARIDRSRVDLNTSGVLAVASANATPSASFSTILSGLIVGDARAAGTLGLGFDQGQLDSTHYNLWLEMYPTGNPADKIISLPAIDVTGNAGITPDKYTLSSIVQSTNDSLRSIGFNLRFIAYQHNGEFGIKMTDVINNASFAIIKGVNSGGTLTTSTYTNNVVGEAIDTYDALGLGSRGCNQASPAYQGSFLNALTAQFPTKILSPVKNKNYIVNGQKRNTFNPTYLANRDGYWDGYISARVPVGLLTVETTYHIPLDLKAAGLKPGRSITIQPTVAFTDPKYFDVDYGRFIIKSISFPPICPGVPQATEITVINGLHASGNGFGFSSSPALPVRLFFGSDSVGFDIESVINSSPTSVQYRRHHEVMIDQNGMTFSHERARLPIQAEDAQPSWLGTSKFHIKDVSAKLRGYRDADPTVYNKFVRLYLTAYNSTTGEYDGYLGQRFSAANINVTSVGPLTRGRKNQTVRFFDETYVDYIDVEFSETASPGGSVLSTSLPRFVDVELFPSLRINPEFFFLAVAEVNWTPLTGNDTVQWVSDRRNFGTIDETSFTDNALLSLSAGDRYLHQNGIVRGFSLDTISTVPNSGEVFFKGGVALVNGRIVTANNNSATIPKVYANGTVLPQTLNWAICINERGNLECFVLTSTKQQYFATIGASSWYVPSFTFQELVDTKKNLTVIAVVNVTVASLTINSVNDVRRVILNGTSQAPLTWSGDSQETANFQSATALKNWITNYSSVKNRVKVIGTIEVTSTIDLTGFTKEVLIDGSEGAFNVNLPKGFLIGSNVKFDSCTFNYIVSDLSFASLGLIAGDEINSGNGCIYAAAGTDLSSVTIKNCTFTTFRTTQRPPFINFEMNKGQVNDQIRIIKNKFIESIPSNENQAAVVIFQLNAGASVNPAVLSNSEIYGNVCSHKQGIYITTVSQLIAGINASPSPGLNVLNTNVTRNSCGKIGFMTSSVENSLSSQTQVDRSQELSIEKNNCLLIANIIGNSFPVLTASFQYATGSVKISENACSWIYLNQKEDSASNAFCTSKITNNTLTGYDPSFLLYPLPNSAISVGDTQSYSYQTQVIISGNTINFGRADSITYGYNYGIINSVSAVICDNVIKGLNDNSAVNAGILFSTFGAAKKRCNIHNNQIYRASASILRYIRIEALGAENEGFIVDNYFDDYSTGTTTTCVDTNTSGSWIVERNKNQSVTAIVPMAACLAFIPGTPASHTLSYFSNQRDSSLSYGDTGGAQAAVIILPLYSVLPKNTSLISATTNVSISNITPTIKTIAMTFVDDTLGISAPTTVTLTVAPQALACSVAGYSSKDSSAGYISLSIIVQSVSSAIIVATAMNVTYRW